MKRYGFCQTCQQEADEPMISHKRKKHPEVYEIDRLKGVATRQANAAAKRAGKRKVAKGKAEMRGDVRVTFEPEKPEEVILDHVNVGDVEIDKDVVGTVPESPPPSSAPKPAGKPVAKQTVAMGSVVTPKTGVVVLKLGPVEIDLEYEHLFNAHLLYNGMKKECGITDSFSHVVEQCIGICLEAMEKNAPIKEAVNGTSGRETEAEAVAESECELIAA